MPVSARYVPRGIVAMEPRALCEDFAQAPPRPNERQGKAVIVSIAGPLAFEPTGLFDTYAAIRCRFDAALAERPAAIVLRINSPGGDVSGSFDLARDMRRKAGAAGVELVAFTESRACSAGYILACAATEIYATDVATLGSIGVIVQVPDVTAANSAAGVKVTTISSGDRKADGNPNVPITDASIAAIAQSVDEMASVFFEHVGASRALLSAQDAQALQAGVRVGRAAVAAGLADGVTSFSALLERFSQ